MKRWNYLIIGALVLLMIVAEYRPLRIFSRHYDAAPTAVAGAAAPAVIHFGGENSFAYNPATVTVAPGQNVVWQGPFGTHVLVSETQIWQPQRAGTAFSYAFDKSGTYPFYCEIHGGPNGGGMSGVVIVK